MSWKPIDTAPKGEEVLVYVPRRMGALFVNAKNATGAQWWGRNVGALSPTHWQPLPEPPSELPHTE